MSRVVTITDVKNKNNVTLSSSSDTIKQALITTNKNCDKLRTALIDERGTRKKAEVQVRVQTKRGDMLEEQLVKQNQMRKKEKEDIQHIVKSTPDNTDFDNILKEADEKQNKELVNYEENEMKKMLKDLNSRLSWLPV